MDKTTFRVIVADDHSIVREGIKSVLSEASGIAVVGEARDGKQVIEVLGQTECDLVVLDLVMPELGGLEVLKQIREQFPDVKVLILSQQKDRTVLRRAISLGLEGYIVKDDVFEKIVDAVEEIRGGGKAFSDDITRLIVDDYAERDERKPTELLTAREREVLHLIAEGSSNKDVAEKLGISVRTAEFHRANIMEKLDIHNVAGLVRFAISEGLA